MAPLSGPDQGALVIIVLALAWALLEHYLSRGIKGTVDGQQRRRWGASILLVGLVLGYGGRLLGVTPWLHRPLVLMGVVLLAYGYRVDREIRAKGGP